MTDERLTSWLLAGEPSIAAQTRRDLLHASDADRGSDSTATSSAGWVASILDRQRDDGHWGVGVYDGDDWNSTTDALWLLHELGVDPADDRVRRAVDLVDAAVLWDPEHGERPYFDGEEEACINGRVLTLGAVFGHPSRALVERLLGEQLADGGWNCDAPASSRSSFHSTICVLEGLLAFELATGPDPAVSDARRRGTDYLLERRLLRRRSDSAVIDDAWLVPHVPAYWCYDALRALDHLRASGAAPDARCDDAVQALREARSPDGTWPATVLPGRPVIELEADGEPSRLVTLRALRVLAWADGSR